MDQQQDKTDWLSAADMPPFWYGWYEVRQPDSPSGGRRRWFGLFDGVNTWSLAVKPEHTDAEAEARGDQVAGPDALADLEYRGRMAPSMHAPPLVEAAMQVPVRHRRRRIGE